VGAGVHFRVWAPIRKSVGVVLSSGSTVQLEPEGNGYFSGSVAKLPAGSLYRFRLGEDENLYPDPASRFQPDGPHGASRVVDPGSYKWKHPAPEVGAAGQVIYELHIGTLTHEGTWRAAERELAGLAELGITLLEVMPVHEFPGSFGWGYDGADLWAPYHVYGEPDDFRHFVDEAHKARLGVILDVVYNHLGPDGNYLRQFSPDYFTDRYPNDWGDSINFDDDNSAPVREFFSENAGYWIEEFHLDGLRLDATQSIIDMSGGHILADIGSRAREAAGRRTIFIVAENEEQQIRLIHPSDRGGYGLDAMWNDDLHHSMVVALTGHNEAYYSDYRGTPQELISAVKWGFLFQGQYYSWQNKPRGTVSAGIPAHQLVSFLENHDQVANTVNGMHLHTMTSPGRLRALTTLVLLGPATPMLFQGQEFASSSPFLYFADHEPALAQKVLEGRRKFLSQFPSLATEEVQKSVPPPSDRETFERCKLDPEERVAHVEALALHRDLLEIRKDDAVLRRQSGELVHGAVLSSEAFVLRFFGEDPFARPSALRPLGPSAPRLQYGDDRLLLINLGANLHLASAAEPLLAPPAGCRWEMIWSSESPRYGGSGSPAVESGEGWRLPGESAVLMRSVKLA